MHPSARRLKTATLGLIALLGVAALSACGKAPTGPTAYAAFSQEDLRLGSGDPAATGNELSVNYSLWLYDPTAQDRKGILLESSIGGTPFAFTLGAGETISGWDRGVPGMQEGGIRRLTIPPSLAYGQERNGRVPPNATLIFEIELLDVAVAS